MTAGLNMMHVSKISLVPIYSRRLRKMEEKNSHIYLIYIFSFHLFFVPAHDSKFPMFIAIFFVSNYDLNFLFLQFCK